MHENPSIMNTTSVGNTRQMLEIKQQLVSTKRLKWTRVINGS